VVGTSVVVVVVVGTSVVVVVVVGTSVVVVVVVGTSVVVVVVVVVGTSVVVVVVVGTSVVVVVVVGTEVVVVVGTLVVVTDEGTPDGATEVCLTEGQGAFVPFLCLLVYVRVVEPHVGSQSGFVGTCTANVRGRMAMADARPQPASMTATDFMI
jgi:hypothetical protein